MRVLHVIPWLAARYGGPATLVPQACVALSRRGVDAEIVTTNIDGNGVLDVPTGRAIDWHGALATFHPVSNPEWYGTSWSLARDLRQRLSSFDVVHIHGLYRFHGLATAILAKTHGIPYVIQAHGSLDPWHRAHRRRAKDAYHDWIEDRIIAGAAAMLCTSRREQSSIRRLGYSVPLQVIPIGVDAADLRAPVAGHAKPDFDDRERVVAFLGRISAKKGVPLLLEAFRSTAAAFPSARLVIAGPDDEGIGRNLEALISGAGLEDRITFTGILGGAEKRSLLQRADVLVLPSADESFGISVAEAMAVGCPVVVSADVAIEDVVRSSGAGMVVDREPAAISDAVAHILREPATAATMGAAGRRVVDEEFSWDVVATRMEALYGAVLRDRPSIRRRSVVVPTPPSRADREPAGLLCPDCRRRIGQQVPDAASSCDACGWRGKEVDGIAILLVRPELSDPDEIDHGHIAGHKAAQSAHFDRPGEEEFETDRPHGTPRLYKFLLGEKFRRAVGPIRPLMSGASALIVCGGSGMDAEYLTRIGADVTTSDLSLGAAIRARLRGKRHRFRAASVVADVERLPFDDESFDTVAVHDGLHHLADPFAGLSEMARVARRWVLVSEPAQAAVTRLAARFGLAMETEAAGNRVARLEVRDVAAFLSARGFVVLRAERYAMYYPHHPDATFRLLSRPGIFPIVRICWRMANKVFGRFGNKMVVVAERPPSD